MLFREVPQLQCLHAPSDTTRRLCMDLVARRGELPDAVAAGMASGLNECGFRYGTLRSGYMTLEGRSLELYICVSRPGWYINSSGS